MKKLLFLFLLIPVAVLSQTKTQNYIWTITYKDSGTIPLENFDDTLAVANITYFDGLGRPIQQIAGRQSSDAKDIITRMAYDAYGRQPKEYLPYAAGQTNLAFVDSGAVRNDQETFYANFRETTTNAYSEKLFEASPLNRVLKQAAPGNPWAMAENHTVKSDYQANGENEVRNFNVILTLTGLFYEPGIAMDGYYEAKNLYKTITKDENWTSGHEHTVEEFKDKEGRVVLKRTYGVSVVGGEPGSVAHDTYYVYDTYGNLTYVLPPLVGNLEENMPAKLDKLCYQYKYDTKNRMIAKKLPGKQWEYIVYDILDRPVLTGPVFDPWGKSEVGWMLTKYDALGRIAYTGWFESDADQADWAARQATFNGWETAPYESRASSPVDIDGKDVNYTNSASMTSFKLLTVNYYDDYDFEDGPSLPIQIEGQGAISNAKGLSTGSWVRLLDDDAQVRGETSYTLYDSKDRPIRTHKQNYLGGYIQADSKLDFIGKTRYTLTSYAYNNTSTPISYREDFTYTPQERPLLHTHTIGTDPAQLIANNELHDQLGTVTKKNVGGDALDPVGLQKIKYFYNIRGWLKGINDAGNHETIDHHDNDLFRFWINYDTVESGLSGEVTPLYNGNISETFWRSHSDDILRKYGYKYDALNRMRDSYYQRPDNAVPLSNSYNESMAYDMNGNILNCARFGVLDDPVVAIQIDDLQYYYESNGNKLLKVTDWTNDPNGFKDDSNGTHEGDDEQDDYAYDANGNMTIDQNKGIESITYNHLNLPVVIEFKEGNEIVYLYNAAGAKLKKTVTKGVTVTVTDYLDGFQYQQGRLKFFPHAEGYVNVTEIDSVNHYNYVFHYKDHLGNIRLSYGVDPSDSELKIMEENHNYPFGLKHFNYNMDESDFVVFNGVLQIGLVTEDNKKAYQYKYNGKEWQGELALNWYDYQARNYDPAIGRWMNLDPLAETSRRYSPYVYALDNPVYFIDPDGMEAEEGTVNIGYGRNVTPSNSSISMAYSGLISGDGSGGLALNFKQDSARPKTQANFDESLGKGVANISEGGSVTLKGNCADLATAEQQNFFVLLQIITMSSKKTKIDVYDGATNIVGGDLQGKSIDIADINAFGSGGAMNKGSVFGHELWEQYQSQVLGNDLRYMDPLGPHFNGIGIEPLLNGGWTRQKSLMKEHPYSIIRSSSQPGGLLNITTKAANIDFITPYTKSGVTKYVEWIVRNGNVTNVKK